MSLSFQSCFLLFNFGFFFLNSGSSAKGNAHGLLALKNKNLGIASIVCNNMDELLDNLNKKRCFVCRSYNSFRHIFIGYFIFY